MDAILGIFGYLLSTILGVAVLFIAIFFLSPVVNGLFMLGSTKVDLWRESKGHKVDWSKYKPMLEYTKAQMENASIEDISQPISNDGNTTKSST